MPLSKDKRQYVEEFIKEAWNSYSSSRFKYFYNDRNSISEIRDYMVGDVDPLRYQNVIVPEEIAQQDDTWTNVNWKPLDIYSKYRRIAIQLVLLMKEKMSIDIVDAMAVDEKEEFFSEVMAQLYLRDKLLEQGVEPEDVGFPEDLPEDQKELEMFMEFSYKHVAAMEFETILTLIKSRNKFDDITYRRLIEDVHDLGLCIVRDVEDDDGEIRLEYVDPEFFFCDYVEDLQFDNADYMGQIKELTIAECKRLMADPSEEAGIDMVQDMMDPNTTLHSQYHRERQRMKEYQDMDSPHLNVVYCQFIANETEEFEIRTTKSGVRVFGNKTSGKKNKEFTTAEFDVVYEGYWIMGTDVFFGVKQMDNTLRDPYDVKKAKYCYHIFASEMKNMHFNSIGKQVIPSIDAINIAWYRLQNAILRAAPKGIAYDLSSLEKVPYGQSGMDPKENIMTYMMTGNLAVRRVDEDGNRSELPIKELVGGIGTEGQEYKEEIIFNENLFRSLTGLNELVDGSAPNPKTLKSVAQQAAVASNNAIKHIHNTVQMVEISASESVIQRVQDQAETDEIEFYAPAVGSNSVSFFRMTKDHSMRQLGLKFEPKPTAEEEQRFQESLQAALATPEGANAQITVAQKAMLEQIDNKKYAMMYLAYVVDKNKEAAQEERERMIQLQAQANQEAAVAAEQEKQRTLKMDGQIKSSLLDKEWAYRIQVEQIKAQGGIAQDQIKADSRDRESARMNETKIAIEEQKAKAEVEKQDSQDN